MPDRCCECWQRIEVGDPVVAWCRIGKDGIGPRYFVRHAACFDAACESPVPFRIVLRAGTMEAVR